MKKRNRILPEFLTTSSQFHLPAFKSRAVSLPLGSVKHSLIMTTNPLVCLSEHKLGGFFIFLFWGFFGRFFRVFFTYNQKSPK